MGCYKDSTTNRALTNLIGTISGDNSNTAENAVNLFTLQDDIALGEQVRAEIESDSSGMELLDSSAYSQIYGYLYSIRDSILYGGEVHYKTEFPWRIRIIKDDSTLNACCAPGGYIYIYTGILKYLEAEDQRASSQLIKN